METVLQPAEVALRLFAAAAAGIIIGINRDLKHKPTGMRTLGLVALGASLATVATVYITGIRSDPDAMSRVVQGVLQGVLTGIAFLGAGAIIRSDKAGEHPGLTTAANVFVVAAIGNACGLGQWWAAFFGSIFAFIILVALSPIEKRLEHLADKRRAGETAKPSNDA